MNVDWARSPQLGRLLPSIGNMSSAAYYDCSMYVLTTTTTTTKGGLTGTLAQNFFSHI